MVCTICFNVSGLISLLKQDRYSSKVIKHINNPHVMYMIFHWLKAVRTCIALAENGLVKMTVLLNKDTITSHGLNQ